MGRTTGNFVNKIDSLDVIYFAVVAHIMMHFATLYKKNNESNDILQEMLVSRYVACVAKEITEPKKQFPLLRGKHDAAIKKLKVGNGCDPSKISNIMTGKKPFDMKIDFVDIGETVHDKRNDRESPVEIFTDLFNNVFEKKRLLMLSLIHIMVNDKYLRNNEDAFELFKKYIYKENGEYIFADFMIGILLYLIYFEKNDAQKVDEKRYAKSICSELNMGKPNSIKYSAENSHIAKLIDKVNTDYKEIIDNKEEDNKVTIKDNYVFSDLFDRWEKKKASTSNGVSLYFDEEEEDYYDSEFWDEQNFRIDKKMTAEIAEELKRRKEFKNMCLNSPDGYDICHFCKNYCSMDIYYKKGGLCSIKHDVVRMEHKKCEYYERSLKRVRKFEKRVSEGWYD